MKKKYFIGIDVSKHTLDVAFIIDDISAPSKTVWKQFSNTLNGLKQIVKWLKQLHVSLADDTIVVIENTGIYHRLLWQFFSSLHVDVCIENAAQVKWSLGIARGKNDKVDSRRLALYAARHADRLKPTPALHSTVIILKDLLTVRNKLIVQTRSFETAIKELKHTNTSPDDVAALNKLLQPALKGLRQSLKQAEQKIKDVLKQDENVYKTYKLLNTIPGIGHITAMYLICCSNMFNMCANGKQLACYSGVVPFDYQSGVSIKGRQHVHKMANKELKRLLHMCALTSIQNYTEFKNYYERKKLGGKHSLSILNAIKNKIILRVFAVVKNDKPYVDKYEKAA